jgi:hypothetical protein
MRKRPLALFCRIALALLAVVPLSAQVPRIVAIGDIHGALEAFVTILQTSNLIDTERRWTGGAATLVQTGDYTDRGPGVRAVMDLLMSLEPQAAAAGGRVIALLGNHEVLNLLGEQRDATPEIYATFADARSDARRQEAFEQYAALAAALAKARTVVPDVYTQGREAWLAAHPPGWLEYREAFSAKGKYGAWLRKRDISVQVAGTLFMHAGLNPTASPNEQAADAEKRVRAQIARVDRFLDRLVDAKLALPFFTLNEMLQVAAGEIRAVNAIVAAAKEEGRSPDLRGFDLDLVREGAQVVGIGDWDVLAEQGPLWYRGYATAPEESLKEPLGAMLARHRATRIVVAHSPLQVRRITARLGGAILLIDTGMLASTYKGRASALEIIGDQLTAIYDDERVRLVPGSAARPQP